MFRAKVDQKLTKVLLEEMVGIYILVMTGVQWIC